MPDDPRPSRPASTPILTFRPPRSVRSRPPMRGSGSPNSCTTSAGRKPSIEVGRSTSRSESWATAPELHGDVMRLWLAIEQLTKWAHDAGVLRTDVSWRDIEATDAQEDRTTAILLAGLRGGTDAQPLPGDPLRNLLGLRRRARIALLPRFSDLKILRCGTTGNGSCGDHLTLGHCAAWPLRPHGRLWSVRRAITPRVAETAGVVVGAMVSHSGIVGADARAHLCSTAPPGRCAHRLMPGMSEISWRAILTTLTYEAHQR
jgi:hypothetical protein